MKNPVRSAPGERPARGDDRGQAAVVLIMVVAVLAAATMSGLGRFGTLAHDRSHAQSIADAAALASLGGGRGQAEAMSAVNGATLRELVRRARSGGSDRGRACRVGDGDGSGDRCPGAGRQGFDGAMTEELRTLVHVSTTEHDLDAAPADGRADEVAGDVVGASVGNGQDSGPVDTHVDTDDDLELDPADADVPARAQDIDIADDDDLDVDLASNREGTGPMTTTTPSRIGWAATTHSSPRLRPTDSTGPIRRTSSPWS